MSRGFEELVSRPSLELATEERPLPPEESKTSLSPRRSLTPLQPVSTDTRPTSTVLPTSSFNVSSSIPISRLFDAFRNTVSLNDYQVIEQTTNLATAVYKQPLSWKEAIMCCLPVGSRVGSSRHLAAIRLSVTVKSELTKVVLTGLYGGVQPLRKFAQDFKTALDKTQGSMPTASGRPSLQNSSMTLRFRVLEESDDESESLPSKQASYYQYVKIMTSEAYSLGRNIAAFLENFMNQYRNIEESARLLPQPMESVKAMIEETVATLDAQLRTNEETMSRPAVEKFIFSKIFAHLFAMYVSHSMESDKRLSDTQTVFRELGTAELMEKLQIDRNFRLNETENPYESAVSALNEIAGMTTPLEKLNCLLKMAALLQTEILDYWKGKVELESMDQELPLLIYVLSRSEVPSLTAELRFLLDYVGNGDEFEDEQRLLVNCEVSST